MTDLKAQFGIMLTEPTSGDNAFIRAIDIPNMESALRRKSRRGDRFGRFETRKVGRVSFCAVPSLTAGRIMLLSRENVTELTSLFHIQGVGIPRVHTP